MANVCNWPRCKAYSCKALFGPTVCRDGVYGSSHRLFPRNRRGGVLVELLYRSRRPLLCRLISSLRFGCGPHRSIALVEKRKMVPLIEQEIDFLSWVPVSGPARRGSGTRSGTPSHPFSIGPTVVSGLAPSSVCPGCHGRPEEPRSSEKPDLRALSAHRRHLISGYRTLSLELSMTRMGAPCPGTEIGVCAWLP